MMLNDETERGQVAMKLKEDGSAELWLRNKSGKLIWKAPGE